MENAASAENLTRFPFRALAPFLLVSFGLTWGILALYVFLPGPTTGLFGELTASHPLYFLATWAPGLAALLLVFVFTGPSGLRGFLGRLTLWRCSPLWYLFLFLGIPILFVTGALIGGNMATWSLPGSTAGTLLTAMLLMAAKGPVEELGWRGIALPLLQRRLVPLQAGLVLGATWALWHAPAFLLSGTPYGVWSFTPFFVGTVAVSVIMTALYNASRGSLLLPVLFHFWLVNPLWPDAQPWDMYLFAAVAVAIVWANRRAMLSRHGAATCVVPGAK